MSVFARANPPTMMVGSSIPSRSMISSSTAGAAVAVRTKPDFRANGVASSALLNTEGKAALAFGDPAAVSRLGTSTSGVAHAAGGRALRSVTHDAAVRVSTSRAASRGAKSPSRLSYNGRRDRI
jgi:hypothetical protein